MDKFYIIANSEKDEGLKVSKRVAEYLENNGKHCVIQPSSFSVREPFTHYNGYQHHSRGRNVSLY